jgi:hypothetical protein
LLPLVGRWAGSGTGVVAATGAQFAFGQQVAFTHDGRPFLAYESRSWLVNEADVALRPAWREAGFWRPGETDDDLEVVIASNTGQSLTFAGLSGDLRWDIATTAAVPTATAVEVDGERRLYAIVDGQLVYATELAPHGHSYAAHLHARLDRMQ